MSFGDRGRTESELQTFFAEYAARFNRALGETPELDVEATAAAFADCFVAASPAGVMCGQNDDQFRAQLPKGMEFYRSIGTYAMKIGSLVITPIDELHALVRVRWESRNRRRDGVEIPIDFDVFYFLQDRDGSPRIFAFITPDEQRILRGKGLIPA